ncbi:MAG: hypothetical protein WDO73_16940 [Ignavibacteriota bacterium]
MTDDHLRAGLEASGATPAQVDSYTRSIRARITQLQTLVETAKASGAPATKAIPLKEDDNSRCSV